MLNCQTRLLRNLANLPLRKQKALDEAGIYYFLKWSERLIWHIFRPHDSILVLTRRLQFRCVRSHKISWKLSERQADTKDTVYRAIDYTLNCQWCSSNLEKVRTKFCECPPLVFWKKEILNSEYEYFVLESWKTWIWIYRNKCQE